MILFYQINIYLSLGHFTIELNVKPTQYGGVVLSYLYQSFYIIVIHASGGLVIIVNGQTHTTSLELNLNSWSQVSLAWRNDVSLLEIYVTSATGTTSVKAVSCPASALTTGNII